jgi:glutathione S-transferase
MTGYVKAAGERRLGFAIHGTATIVLWAGATAAILWRLAHP